MHIARNFGGGGTLLFDCGSNRTGDFVDVGNRFSDFFNRADGVVGFGLDRSDLLGDILGRLGGLVGKVLTSLATTAKPLPASPARAASMVALSARRLVWDAISLIRLTT